MRAFAALYARLDETMRTTEKVESMVEYFRSADPADAATVAQHAPRLRERGGRVGHEHVAPPAQHAVGVPRGLPAVAGVHRRAAHTGRGSRG